MTKNLLVELGLEELPAYVVTPSEKQLGEKMAAFLDDNRLSYERLKILKDLLRKLLWMQKETFLKQHKVLSVEKA